MTLGEYVLSYRKLHGMSQRDFAKISGISNQYISLVEKGVNNDGKPLSPTMDTYKKVADATSVSINELLMIVSDNITVNSYNTVSDDYYKILSSLSDKQLDSLLVALISDRDKDYLLQLAAKILEIASKK